MGVLYKETCVASGQEAADLVMSELTWNGFPIEYVISLFDPIIIVGYDDGGVSKDFEYSLPTCTYTGLENFMGVPLDDAVTTSWLVALTLITAWSIVVLRRTF